MAQKPSLSMKLPPKMPQRAMVRIWVASLHQELRYPMGTGVSVLSVLQKGLQGWIRTAAEPTAACGGNREARLGQRSDFSRPRQGVAEKSASATRKARRHTSRRFTSRRAKTAAARKAPCGGCSHFVESSGKITSRTRQCTRSRTLPAAS